MFLVGLAHGIRERRFTAESLSEVCFNLIMDMIWSDFHVHELLLSVAREARTYSLGQPELFWTSRRHSVNEVTDVLSAQIWSVIPSH